MTKKNYREEIADFFILALDEDPIEFIKGWNFSQTGSPMNSFTDKEYSGINKLYLKIIEVKNGYGDNRWLTFKQIQDKGYHLQKGAKGAKVEYYIPYDNKEKKWISFDEYSKYSRDPDFDGERFSLKQRIYTVFNASMIDGIKRFEPSYTANNINEEEVIKKISDSIGVKIVERRNSQSAFYDPGEDYILIPEKEQFKSQEDYCRTVLHELSHSTGHKDRLNRDQGNEFGSKKYAFEELIAEISSSFMGEYIEEPLTDEILDKHKAYIQSWAKEIKNNKNFLFKAIKEAEKAADYMIENAQLYKYKRDHTLDSMDYWRVEFNEQAGFINKNYQGEVITEDLLKELRDMDNDVWLYNKTSEDVVYLGTDSHGIGSLKFYITHYINGEAQEDIRIDIGDGEDVNSELFDKMTKAVYVDNDIQNEVFSFSRDDEEVEF